MWKSAMVEVAASGRLAKIWATRDPDGLERALDGLGRAGGACSWCFMEVATTNSLGLGQRRGLHVATELPEVYGPVWAWSG
jgi:hypothetical protein